MDLKVHLDEENTENFKTHRLQSLSLYVAASILACICIYSLQLLFYKGRFKIFKLHFLSVCAHLCVCTRTVVCVDLRGQPWELVIFLPTL